jgi:hypothetical protein
MLLNLLSRLFSLEIYIESPRQILPPLYLRHGDSIEVSDDNGVFLVLRRHGLELKLVLLKEK